ncbi:MAG TPA: VanZ family protein [Candidatus Angelobacter sp.]|nr:VanZ family protein [Candidatus Angelobacter sp.]
MSSSAMDQQAPASPQRKLRAWIPTLLWLCVLAIFSTDLFSAEHTGSILARILDTLFPHLSAEWFERIHFLVRKSAHFCSYGLLGAFSFFSWRATFPAPVRWRFLWATLGLLTAFAGGSMDEFHQSFVPSRTSSFHDVMIDTVGGLFFQLMIALWLTREASSRQA